MPWMYAVIGLVVGLIIGYALSRFMTPDANKQKSVQKELDSAKFELEQQRQELADHFSQTAELLDVLGKDYTKLYQHMTTTSAELLPNLPEQDNPFIKAVADAQPKEEQKEASPEAQPKDYAHGATGMLKDEEKEIIENPQTVIEKKSA
ncbi:Z-ring associated protein ZapG [Vibrio sp. SCSIO 43136]|uniref:Z-ring associated protein ZapG n=1 Tax=Vibrio sp. SCSIO 43136 TaxID=2819101 RepID=UPI002075CBC7|nr:Z-ring associated protein ZapG [Vibrio sp. SCSIO 43136]USD64895.1 DUF1043 family protein [Vibrio sp. SCSIO 43136]